MVTIAKDVNLFILLVPDVRRAIEIRYPKTPGPEADAWFVMGAID